MFYVFIFILGAVIGSFLNVVIWRLHSGEKIYRGRSHCPRCQAELRVRDLWPLFSFIFLRGRCRYCQAKISWQYPLVELATAILFVLTAKIFLAGSPASIIWASGPVFWQLARNLFFVAVLVVIFVYDWRWYLILDQVTFPALLAALLFNLFLGWSWLNLLLGALVGFGFFALQYWLSRGRWIGGGDLRLGALLGLMLGWPQVLVALFFAYITGLVAVMPLLLFGRKQLKSQIPFGTFLAVGAMVALWWGQPIVDWYLKLI